MKKNGLILSIVTTALVFSNCTKDTDFDTYNVPEKTIDNQVVINKKGYGITKGQIGAGKYDGGPKYFVAIALNSSNVESRDEYLDDDVESYKGKGNGCFLFFKTPDSLKSGTYPISEAWVAGDYDFDASSEDIYDESTRPSNLIFIEDEQDSVIF